MSERWSCRMSPTLGVLEDSPENIWGTKVYDPVADTEDPTVFMGIYSLVDFYALWRHRGSKAILWCGSDIPRLKAGYWLDVGGKIRIPSKPIANWIQRNCDNWVENVVERNALRTLGIASRICPSFLGRVEDYSVSYSWSARPKVYASVSGNDFGLYQWPLIEEVADKVDVEFHLYGNTQPWVSRHTNVVVHGRISKEQMNEEIRYMQAGFRPLPFDGCSEIIVKSALWGQHTISRIAYPEVTTYRSTEELIVALNDLRNKREPNILARNWFLQNINRYPWCSK